MLLIAKKEIKVYILLDWKEYELYSCKKRINIMGFTKSKKEPVQAQSSPQMVKLFTWVKSLETKINSLTREFELIKNESLRAQTHIKAQVKHISETVTEVKHAHEKLNQTVDLLIKEIKQTAGSSEVEVLKKYIEYWNPINFVTQKDLDRYFEVKMKELEEKKKQKKTMKSSNELTPRSPSTISHAQ